MPFPVPDALEVMLIQLTGVDAVQAQPIEVVTVAVKFPPDAAGATLVGLIA